MKRPLVLAGVGGVLATAFGWSAALIPSIPESAGTRIAPVLTHAGGPAGASRAQLLELGLGQVEVFDAAAIDAPPAPDIARLFRRDLTAIEQTGGVAQALIVDYAEPSGRRRLRAGDIYQDGWRIARITPQQIELRRRRETRSVAVFEIPNEDQP